MSRRAAQLWLWGSICASVDTSSEIPWCPGSSRTLAGSPPRTGRTERSDKRLPPSPAAAAIFSSFVSAIRDQPLSSRGGEWSRPTRVQIWSAKNRSGA